MSSGSRTIVRKLKLSDPIHDAGETITELQFSKPKGRLFLKIENMNEVGGAQIISVVADICGISEEACEEMDFHDLAEAGRIAGELMSPKKKGRSKPASRHRAGGARR